MFENLVIVQQPIKKEKIEKKKDCFSVGRRTDKITAAGFLLLQMTLYRAKMDLPTES